MLLPIHIAAGGLAMTAYFVGMALTTSGVRCRGLLLFGAMFYWLWRVRGRRTLPVLVGHDSVALPTLQPTTRHG
jgi:hypothetical protein